MNSQLLIAEPSVPVRQDNDGYAIGRKKLFGYLVLYVRLHVLYISKLLKWQKLLTIGGGISHIEQ